MAITPSGRTFIRSYSSPDFSKVSQYGQKNGSNFNLNLSLEPSRSSTASNVSVAESTIKLQNHANDALKHAKEIGINLAKKDFFFKMLGVVVSGMALGVAVAATVLTGGGAVPLTVLVGGAFLLAVSDAGCAFRNWRDKASDDPNRPGMAMGNDSVANAVHFLATKINADQKTANYCAKAVSLALRASLTAATIWAGFFNTAFVAGSTGSLLGGISAGTSTLREFVNKTDEFATHQLQEKMNKFDMPEVEKKASDGLDSKVDDVDSQAVLERLLNSFEGPSGSELATT